MTRMWKLIQAVLQKVRSFIIGYTIPLGTREKVRPINTGSQNHKPKLSNAEKIPEPVVT